MLALCLRSRYVLYTTHTCTIEVYLAWYVKCVIGCRGMVRTEVLGDWDDLLV